MSFTIFVYRGEECHQLSPKSGKRVTIGGGKHDTLSLPDAGLLDAQFLFAPQEDRMVLTAKNGVFSNGIQIREVSVAVGDVFLCREVSVYICPKQRDGEYPLDLSINREILIGRSKECSVRMVDLRVSSRHARIVSEDGRYKLIDLESKNHTFVNGRRVATCYLEDKDLINIGYYGMVYEKETLFFLNVGNDLKLNMGQKGIAKKNPSFRRSPRMKVMHEAVAFKVQAPPNIGEKPQINWLVVFLPPLVMAGVSIASILFSAGSLMTLLFLLPMSFVTLLTTVLSYFSQVHKYQKEKRAIRKRYEKYIDQMVAEVETAYNQQLLSANNVNPNTAYCLDIVTNRMRCLWERSADDADFLDVRLGKGVLPLKAEILLPETPAGEDMNPQLHRLQESLETFRHVKDIAVTLPVRSAGTIGVVGNRQIGIRAVQNGIVQLVTSHSYHEVKLAILTDEQDYEKWAWTRWLPHTWDKNRRIRFVSSDRKSTSELLGYFEEILKKRMDLINQDEYQKGILLPHLVFVITNVELTENRDFLRLITAADKRAGVSAFLLFDSLNKLPKECSWFIELKNSGGSLYSRSNSTDRISFTLDLFEEYERFARAMAPIRERSITQERQMPSSVSFFQGYSVADAAELQIRQRWEAAKPYQSLAVPIGIKENGKTFLFDIHEKAHGPHGLVAGTTGSGKSELLQTYILSMCVNFSPQDVSFVLIDFKGTGLAGALKNLPHIAGVITDIDENIQRNLFSLEAEIERRKKRFDDVSGEERKIQDIYEYQKAYDAGILSEPLSHLIVVVDEFTELKSRFPDFMMAVDRASRVGRTLGIHLILATQKPGGAVSDEMKANANFKWCLRVREGESRDVLGRAEAERIPQEYPGRAWVQVGNNEIFELVQTYYSGADIQETGTDDQIQVSFVNSMGQRETIGSGEAVKKNDAATEKELFQITKHVLEVAKNVPGTAAKKIWENSLPRHLILSDLPDTGAKSALLAVIGLVDDPHHQRQYPCEIDFGTDGHVLIYGAPGTGKTMLLQTLVMSLAERYTPDEVHLYVLDFGSWSMKNLQMLPHIGDVVNGNEEEKILHLARMLTEELDRRKTLFARTGAGNMEVYRQVSNEKTPYMVVLVDHFAPVQELYPEIENVFVRLSREGGSFGMFLVITASSVIGSVSYYLSQNFRQKLTLWMTEKGDYLEIVGDTEGLEPLKTAGRGLVKGKPPMEFQTALAVSAENDAEYVSNLKKRCCQLAAGWKGSLPEKIPVMPEVILFHHIKNLTPDRIVVGLSEDQIAPVTIPCENCLTLISGTEESGKTNMLRAIMRQLGRNRSVIMVDADQDTDRNQKIADAVKKAAAGEPLTLLIDEIPCWLSDHTQYEVFDVMEQMIKKRKNYVFSLYATGSADDITRESCRIMDMVIQYGLSILIGGSFHEHSSQFEAGNISYSQENEQLLPHYGYLIEQKKAVKFKALFDGGDMGGI